MQPHDQQKSTHVWTKPLVGDSQVNCLRAQVKVAVHKRAVSDDRPGGVQAFLQHTAVLLAVLEGPLGLSHSLLQFTDHRVAVRQGHVQGLHLSHTHTHIHQYYTAYISCCVHILCTCHTRTHTYINIILHTFLVVSIFSSPVTHTKTPHIH